MTRLPDHERLAFDRWLETASLIKLVNEHSALNHRLNLGGAKHWAEQYAQDERNLALVWQTIGRRFPDYIAEQRRLARERREHEARVMSDGRSGADENWRPVSGWENLYEVSDLGRVRSLRSSSIARPARLPSRRLCHRRHRRSTLIASDEAPIRNAGASR